MVGEQLSEAGGVGFHAIEEGVSLAGDEGEEAGEFSGVDLVSGEFGEEGGGILLGLGFLEAVEDDGEGGLDTGQAAEAFGAVAVVVAHAIEAEVGGSVVGGHDDQGFGVATLEVDDQIDGFVEGDHLAEGGGGVVVVGAVVDSAAFDLKEEVLVAAEFTEGEVDHFGEGRDLLLCLRIGAGIEGIGEVTGGEGAEPGLIGGGGLEFVAGFGEVVAFPGELGEEVAFIFAFGGVEVVLGAAEEEVESAGEVLVGDFGAVATAIDADGESGGGGVGDFGGGDEAAFPTGLTEEVHQGEERPAFGGDVEGAVADAASAAPARGGGGGIGDDGVQGPHVHEGGVDVRLLEQIDPGEGAVAFVAGKLVGTAERAVAHAVGHDMNDAAGRAVAEAGGAGCREFGASGSGVRGLGVGATDGTGGGGEGGKTQETTPIEHAGRFRNRSAGLTREIS